MNLDDFSTVIEDRRYINPQVGLDESNAFIENLRNTQQANTQEIAQDTYNLGTAVPSNLGGLSGAGTYFTSRYQTPQTNEVIANLRSAAQAQALNEALNNKLAQAKERYNKAYKAASKRGGGGSPMGPTDKGSVGYKPTNLQGLKKPGAGDYISGGYTFGRSGNLPGQSGQYPLTVDTPTYSTSYETFSFTKDPIKKAQEWVDYLDSIGYGG